MTDHAAKGDMVRRILVATDLSGASEPVIAAAADIAHLAHADLLVLHVFTPEDYVEVQRDSGLALDEYMDRLRTMARHQVEQAGGSGDRVRVEVLQGESIPREILAVAAAREVQMIVLGTRGRTGLRRLLLGSVAEEVLRHAACPVLVVPQAVLARRLPAGAYA